VVIELPRTLIDLITSGRWPRVTLHRKADIEASRVRTVFPDEDDIHFLAPPFCTAARRVRGGEPFWTWPFAAPTELDAARAVVIGDFGLGSDAPIILDYQHDALRPCVRYLQIRSNLASRTTDNHWMTVASSFDEFATALNLASVDWSAFRGAAEQKWPAALVVE
jgi:hypothetical protein